MNDINELNDEGRRAKLKELLFSLAEREDVLKSEKEITCLFASEFTACKIIYEAINRMKKNIPNDYSLITFDYSMGLVNPNIARIIQNQEFMAQMAVSVLIKLINKENVAVKLYSPYTIYQGNSIKDIK